MKHSMTTEVNMSIIYVRCYGGALVPINKVELITVDPNNGSTTQNIPLARCIQDLMYYNMNNFAKVKDAREQVESFTMLQKVE